MKELIVDATIDNLTEVSEFIDAYLEEIMCPMKAQLSIDVVVEEIYVNIAHYAYPGSSGKAVIRADGTDEVRITFIDEGIPFDPLAKADPDVTLSAEERQIGGLGIFMVKKMMDDVIYERKDGKNILTCVKNIRPEGKN